MNSTDECRNVDLRKERSSTSILLIFVSNLIGFWFILPAFLLLSGFLLDDIFSAPSFARLGAVLVIIGATLLISGLLLSFYSILLFAYYGDGMPIASLPPKRLVVEGSYSRTRHPIYLGYTVSLIGLGLLFASTSFLFIVLPLFTSSWLAYAILHEEKILKKRYGSHYGAYLRVTPLLFSMRSAQRLSKRPVPPFLYMLSSVLFKVLGKIYFHIEVSGDSCPDVTKPYIMVANHANYLDPFFINSHIRDFVRMSVTEKAFRNPLVRFYLKKIGAFPIARYDAGDIRAVRQALRLLQGGYSIGIFPEGERTWDGRTLHFSDTILRFLKRAGVPIFVVNIAGAYNVFPRWARRPRRGNMKLHFHEPFFFSENGNLEEDRAMLQQRLFFPGGSYNETVNTTTTNMAEGLAFLLWRCPICGANESLTVENHAHLTCICCASMWKLLPNYHLKLLKHRGEAPLEDSVQPLAQWYSLAESLDGPVPIQKSYPFLEQKEDVLLESEVVKYREYYRLKKTLSRKGRLILTDRRLIFVSHSLLISEPLESIKKIVTEGRNQLELGFAGRMVSIRFVNESPLKWQVYLGRVKSGVCHST